MVTPELESLKVKIDFLGEGNGSFTFSKVKKTASNEQIYEMAEAINAVQKINAIVVYKLEEYSLEK